MKLLIKLAYKFKFYIDIAIGNISWITAKLPELMALIYILDKFGISLTKRGIILLALFGGLGLFVFGFIWKHIGYYDIEQYVHAERNPVQNELLKAARKINDKDN